MADSRRCQDRVRQVQLGAAKGIGTRSSAIQRKLRDVERLEETQATQLLGLSIGADEES